MSMNGIDISSWQSGIDLSVVPCDFVIAKATEGTTYTNPDCARAIEQAISLGKAFGVYHYVAGGNAQSEADYFVDSVAGWIGRGVLAIDWEAGGNSAWGDESYLDRVVKRVIERTGIKPLIYASASAFPWSIAAANDCGAWVAQYASNDATGYQDSPWNEGAYDCAIRQYSSAGQLNGYSGSLDLNKFYGDSATWSAYVGGSVGGSGSGGGSVTPQQVPGDPVNSLGMQYQAHVQELGTLDAVHDGQIAGTTGYGLQLEGLYVDITKIKAEYPSAKVNARAHIEDGGWVLYEDVKPDTLIGTIGQSRQIEALEFELVNTPYSLIFQVHVADIGWTGETKGGFTSGTTGLSRQIEAIRIWLT